MNKPKRLIRKRINSLLSDIFSFSLTIIEAPAGYGKTTAVRGFLPSQKAWPLWISFQPINEAPEYFWEKLSEGISEINISAGNALKSLGYPANAVRRNQVLSIMNRLELTERTVMVFDNYELVTDPFFGRLLLQLAEDGIENLYLIIITRDTTGLDYLPLFSKGKCTIISQQQIKFTRDEVREYCALMDSRVTNAQIEKITEYTDGWISLIYIVLLGLKENIPIGFNQTLDELIDQTLFLVLDDDLKQFVLRLSTMHSFTVQQAAFVTGRKNAVELLRRLQKKNIFIWYDHHEGRYKIHPVLLDFLHTKQDFTPEEQRELNRRLGEWNLKQNDLPAAYMYLARAGEAEQIFKSLNSPERIRNEYTDFEGADTLFATAPGELLFTYPIAYLRYLFFAILSQRRAVTCTIAQRLDELTQFYLHNENLIEDEQNRYLAEITCVRKFLVFNDLPRMTSYSKEIARLLNGKKSFIVGQNDEFTFGSPHFLYLYFRDSGSFKRLVSTFTNDFSHPSFSDGCGTGCDSLAFAEYALETGDLGSAALESQKAIYKAETKAQWSIIICAKFCGMRAAAAAGNISIIHETIRQLQLDINKLNNPVYNSMLELCKGYLYASMGMRDSIPLWLKTGDMSSLNLFYGGIGFDMLVYAKTLLACEEYVKLEALHDSFEQSFNAYHNRLGLLYNEILLAAARAHLYGIKAGIPRLEFALNMAQSDKIVLPFAECAPHLLPMLDSLSETEKQNSYFQCVWQLCRQYERNIRRILPKKHELTARELEILSLLSEGLNRNEIAAHLVISPLTVKTHLQSIYKKLDSDGKSSAVKIARLNGYI